MQTITRIRSLFSNAAILAVCMTFPVPGQAEVHEATGRRASTVRSLDVSPKVPLEPRAYLKERRRHDRIRGRADVLSKNPMLSGYREQAVKLGTEDDRKMEELDLLTRSAGGYEAALVRLKRHNNEMLRMVRKAQAFTGD